MPRRMIGLRLSWERYGVRVTGESATDDLYSWLRVQVLIIIPRNKKAGVAPGLLAAYSPSSPTLHPLWPSPRHPSR